MSVRDKIKPLPELATALAGLRGQGRKVVHCHGVFDLLHVGHLRYFEEAKGMGDVLKFSTRGYAPAPCFVVLMHVAALWLWACPVLLTCDFL